MTAETLLLPTSKLLEQLDTRHAIGWLAGHLMPPSSVRTLAAGCGVMRLLEYLLLPPLLLLPAAASPMHPVLPVVMP